MTRRRAYGAIPGVSAVAVAVALLATFAVVVGVGWRAHEAQRSSQANGFPAVRVIGPGTDSPARSGRDAGGEVASRDVWPSKGQAAYRLSTGSTILASPGQRPVPIASVAKVMTAYVVLRDHPLAIGQDGPTITLTSADVADADRRAQQGQSVVPVISGEQLSERQALLALLLPSANNIAVVLARWDAGSLSAFVDRMNAAAASLGMTHTHYTDPSGYEHTTVSTAADQVRIVDAAMRVATFAAIVATPSAALPVAGTVRNTDQLLGHDGFVGVKTGSDSAAGGCFAFRAIATIAGTRTTITGVVLGQPGQNPVTAGQAAAGELVELLTRPARAHRSTPPHLPGADL
ncbi:MAG TPA: hypothetical protein VMH41_08995 [Mycobacteriales bacterium]|nr:hypothetical protein [Mycobacteriales bacterium]